MPIPFIIGAVAIAAGAFGVKKGLDAKENYDEAEKINNAAQDAYNRAVSKLEAEKKNTNAQLENLGEFKVKIYQNQIIPFLETFLSIKNLGKSFTYGSKVYAWPTEAEFDNIRVQKDKLTDVFGSAVNYKTKGGMSDAVSSLNAASLAGVAAYGAAWYGVGAFATASTGTAIAGLSGAAATSSTLAWLGGGSLAAGGFGVAGGMAVLGGIIAGPLLAVGGMVFASKSEDALNEAKENAAKADDVVRQVNEALGKIRDIKFGIEKIQNCLDQHQNSFIQQYEPVALIVSEDLNYQNYTEEDKFYLYNALQAYQLFSEVLNIPLLTKDGNANPEALHLRY